MLNDLKTMRTLFMVRQASLAAGGGAECGGYRRAGRSAHWLC